jgi:putative NADH-flavin reductase
MNILLIGASGMIGSRILKESVERGHSVIAAVRRPERVAPSASVRAVALDATDAAAIARLAKDAEVIVSAVSPRGGGDPIEEATAVGRALISAASQTGKRLLVVGGAGSLSLPDGAPVAETLPDAYRAEGFAMREVLKLLTASSVDWTFFSPAATIAPGARTGVFRLGSTELMFDARGQSKISAEDYAAALVDELEAPAHHRAQMTIAY